MQVVEIKKGTQNKFDDLVQRVSLLNNTDLMAFFEQLNVKISGQKVYSTAGSEEIILLKQIKTIIPVSVVRRFKALQAKQHDNSLSEKEHEEILVITNFIEEKSAERVELLAILAKIRQISLLELVKQLPFVNLRKALVNYGVFPPEHSA
jgi:hypothetical protein